MQEISVGSGPTGIDFGAGSVWVANSLDGTVSRIDTETNSVTATIPTGNGPTALDADERGVWVSNQFDGTIVRIDPTTNQVTRRITVGNRPQGVAVADGTVLVGVRESDAAHRGGTLTVRNDLSPDSIDTAIAYSPFSWPYLRMTNDGLVAFNQVAGVGGTQLVPDLAVSLPAPTDGGLTYTFQLRRGIRYSTGRPVKASDVRATLERGFRIGLQVPYYDGIVGAAGCRRTPQSCDLSRGIVTDDAAGTVTFHLVTPDPEFLHQLAIPSAYVLPAGTPARETGTHPLPATGPYVMATYRPNGVIRLERNPYFREWSKSAQPDGYPDTIVVKLGGTADEAIDDVVHGKADLMSTILSGIPSPSRLAEIKTRYASQIHTNPAQQTASLFLNTHLAPFDRLDVRQAVSYAVDRAAAVQIQGGPDLAEATCQILPAHYPGYRRYCPYTVSPSVRGTWTATRPRQGTSARGAVGDTRHEDHRLGLRARQGLRPTAGEGARIARIHGVGEDARRQLQRDRLCSAHEGADRVLRLGHRLSPRVDVVQRSADVRLAPGEHHAKLERCRVLRPADRPADHACPERAGDRSGRRTPTLGAHRPRAGRPSAVGSADLVERGRRPREERRQLPVQRSRHGSTD